MKTRTRIILVVFVSLFALFLNTAVHADDGQMFRRNISKTPEAETEEAAIHAMEFYVPAQAADGTLLTEGIPYFDAEGNLVETREYARPLVSIYIDGIEEVPEGISRSATGSRNVDSGVSFGAHDAFAAVSLDDGATWKLTNLSDSAHLSSFTLQNGTEYPGDVYRMEFAVAGNKIFAVWMSRFCSSGSPAYSLVDEFGEPLYPDLFGVAGAQGSVDYTLQGYPEIGEIPYGCVWTARGTLEYVDETGAFEVLWRKPERLTSGRRDANVQAVAGDEEAGFVIVWQEDPEGLRPGQGLGPGEGWSGAIVNQKTDMWYSYIPWDNFDAVIIDELDPDTLPKVAAPMTVPLRLTDNNMCKYDRTYDDEGNLINPYCYEDFDLNGTADLCAAEVAWINPGGTPLDLCQTEDGRVLWGRTGASRTRLGIIPYVKTDGTTSAWVVMAYEETKGLGEGSGDLEPIDIGKDILYHSFDMYEPDIAAQGAQLNQPAVDHETGAFFPVLLDEWGNEFYNTEIARRFNIIIQPPEDAGPAGTPLLAIFKQGIFNQGGPADIMLRRFVIPEGFDPAVDNPYDISNMVCDNWAYTDGSNPLYLEGLCLDPPINISGTNIVSCDLYGDPESCADAFPWEPGATFPKVTEWVQVEENLDDQSWENPYDVAKGHRGFMDGDFIMLMYAWSPNWKSNSVGNDKYNLYIRRSFDGGGTWTTTPAALGGNGTCHIENYLTGESVETCYPAGAFEQARNVSQLIGTKVTILDPRYTPTMDSIIEPSGYTGPFFYPNYWDDIHNPSLFFIVYETGDNTTVAEGEATPLDLFYSRGYDYGDVYDYVEWYNSQTGELELRWDWLENKQDDLSGEASVVANPGGTFFYAVWNQWNEFTEDVITNSDSWFRRVMYLDTVDGMPTAEILFVSDYAVGHNETGEIELIATAKDNDHIGAGIEEVKWVSSLDGLLSTEGSFTIPYDALSPGQHILTFSARDDEGNWAADSVTILVAEELKEVWLPIIFR